MDDDGPSWEMQQDNEERRRWEEEQAALNRCRALTRELRDETKQFERDMTELNERIETNWREFYGDHG